jgi:hypothetical protein
MRRALAFLCLLAFPACGPDTRESDAMFRISDDSGAIKVELVGTDAAGTTYRLRKATFEVSGNAMLTLQGREGTGLYAPLPQGDYQMYLRPGYELVEQDADGHDRVVDARLSSPNPTRLHVTSRVDGTVALSFHAERGEITFGERRALRASGTTEPTVLAASAAP